MSLVSAKWVFLSGAITFCRCGNGRNKDSLKCANDAKVSRNCYGTAPLMFYTL